MAKYKYVLNYMFSVIYSLILVESIEKWKSLIVNQDMGNFVHFGGFSH